MNKDQDPKASEAGDRIAWTDAMSRLRPVDSSRLIKVGDQQGIFTPIAGAGDEEASTGNLEAVVQALRAELQRLDNENLALRGQVEALEAERKRTPDDFASAVSHTLDTLQTRLHETKNPVSRFAVRGFSIEASVYVDVSPLGTIDYRFSQPGDSVDPGRLSRIKLDLVPLPKEDSAGTWTQPEFTPFVDVEEIQGVGEEYQKRLNAKQIYSVGDLLTAATRVRSQAQLSAMLDIDRTRLAEWLSHAELLTIRDIDGRRAEVLSGLGIRRLSDLAGQDPAALTEAFNERVAAAGVKALKPVDEVMVRTWIQSATAYVGRVEPPSVGEKEG